MAEKIVKDSQCLVNDLVNDTISRQSAIDATWFEPSYTDPLNVLTEVRDKLKALPSAQPEWKRGKWKIYVISLFDGVGCRCSECGFEGVPYWDFCPNCGARMDGEDGDHHD